MKKVERINGKTARHIMSCVTLKTIVPSISTEVYMQCGKGNFYYCDKDGKVQETAKGAAHIKVIRTGNDFSYHVAGMLPIPENKRI